MALQWEPIEIVLTKGLDQKRDGKLTQPGKLETAINVEFDKAGALNKRRGYGRPQWVSADGGTGSLGVNIGIRKDELSIFTYNDLYALGSLTDQLFSSKTWVLRGPAPRGNVVKHVVATSRSGSDQPQES